MDNGLTGSKYLKSHSGGFKVLQIICCIVILCCLPLQLWSTAIQLMPSYINFYHVTPMLALIYSTFMFIGSLMGLGATKGSTSKFDVYSCFTLSILVFCGASIYSASFMLMDVINKIAIVVYFFLGFAYAGNVLLKIK